MDSEQEATQGPSMTGPTAILFALLGGFSLLAFLYPRRRVRYLADIRGPQSSSFWLGIFAPIRRQVDINNWIFIFPQVTRLTFDTRMK
jgi:hypothetical protein